jgi:hypothetical protein
MAKKGRHILEKVEKIHVNHSRNSSRRHCGAQSEQWCAGGIYRLSILVSAGVSQPIQKIISIGYLISADTINHIFGIGCTMSVNTNNVSGIRGVTRRRKTLTHDEILVCTVRLPDFSALYAATSLGVDTTSLYATPSMSFPSVPLPPPSTPRCCYHHHQPHPWATLPSASTPPVVSPSSSPTPSHRPRLLLRPRHSVLPA